MRIKHDTIGGPSHIIKDRKGPETTYTDQQRLDFLEKALVTIKPYLGGDYSGHQVQLEPGGAWVKSRKLRELIDFCLDRQPKKPK